jgi:rubrerythrin
MTHNVNVAMGMFDPLRGLFSESAQIYHECRDCGLTLDTPIDECPHCESGEIAEYRL